MPHTVALRSSSGGRTAHGTRARERERVDVE